MSSLSPLGTRQYQNSALAGSTQQPARGNSAVPQAAAGKASSNVALSSGAVDLQQRIDALGNDTIDLAQNFLGKFAHQLLGDSAKGATIAFDSVSLDTSSTFAAGTLRSEGAEGIRNAYAFSLNESSHFLGKGTITLADGSKYDFEVEVRYEASMSAGFAGKEGAKPAEQNTPQQLPTFEFPDIDWPGSLGDLFKLMDKQISGDVKQGENGDVLGNLSVRLMQLVKNTQSLDTYAPTSPVKAYQAESGAEPVFGPATEKTQMPIKVPTAPVAEAPAEAPAGGPAEVPIVKSAGDIPLTISTTPPPDDAS